MGKKNFLERGAGFSKKIKTKNNEKINMKEFFQLKVRSSIKTKRTGIITHIRGSSPPEYLLFALKNF